MRNRFVVPVLGLMFMMAVAARAQDKKEGGFDAAKLLGEWSFVSGMRAGDKASEQTLAGTVIFDKETLKLPAGPDATFVIAYKIDASKSPMTIDMEIKDGPVKEGKALGILELKGDELKLCYIPETGSRPEKFESTTENGAFYFTLKRKKKE